MLFFVVECANVTILETDFATILSLMSSPPVASSQSPVGFQKETLHEFEFMDDAFKGGWNFEVDT